MLIPVGLPVRQGIFLAESTFSADSYGVRTAPMCSVRALPSVRMLKVPGIGSRAIVRTCGDRAVGWALDAWSKGCEFRSWQDWRENFLLQGELCVLTLIRCPFHPCVTAVARKRPQSFCQKCSGRLHLNTHTPLTQWSQSGLTMLLSRHSVGTYAETNIHSTCHGTFGHSHLSSLSHCGLIMA